MNSANEPIFDMILPCAKACVAAYGGGPLKQWTYDKTLSVGHSQLRVMANSRVGLVAIAGTNSLADWVNNLDASVKRRGPFRLHSGFAKAAEVVLAAILSLDDLPNHFANGNWVITGHSLGGAVAAIVPALLAVSPSDRLELPRTSIGFGVPNYSQGPATLLWPCDVVAINSSRDIVAHLPNGLFSRAWTRAGMQVYCDDSGLHCYPGHELLRIASLLWRVVRFAWLREIQAIAEHSMDRYAGRVAKGVSVLESKRAELDV